MSHTNFLLWEKLEKLKSILKKYIFFPTLKANIAKRIIELSN